MTTKTAADEAQSARQIFTPFQADKIFTPFEADNQPVATQQAKPPVQYRQVTDKEIEALGDDHAIELSQLSKQLLSSVKASDADQFGSKLNELVATAKGLDPSKFQRKGIVGTIMNLFGNTKEKFLAQYQTIDNRMMALVSELDKSAQLQRKRVGDLDQMFEANERSFNGLTEAEEYGKTILHDMEIQLAEMTAEAQQDPDSFKAQAVADFKNKLMRLEKRIDDIGRAKHLAKLAAPQIRLMQDNARSLAEKFADIKVTTIPAWQNAFSMFLVQMEQQKGAALANAVHDATDDAFRMQADLLRSNTQDIARAKARSLVTVETLQHVQQQLLGAIDDAQQVADEARKMRVEAVPRIKQMDEELIKRFTSRGK
jgi:uncharacterized protein YaaN involved in tellurite resistance